MDAQKQLVWVYHWVGAGLFTFGAIWPLILVPRPYEAQGECLRAGLFFRSSGFDCPARRVGAGLFTFGAIWPLILGEPAPTPQPAIQIWQITPDAK